MDPTCPRCGSDAAVTWTTTAEGMQYTCRFSHSGEGSVAWVVPARARQARTPAASRSAAPRTPAAPRQRRSTAASRADAPAHTAHAPLTVNERGIAAVVEEVDRRGGHAQVEREGHKREVVVTGEGGAGAVRLVVHTRTAGSWQTKASYGEPRAEEQHPTTFWVLVDLGPGSARCYVVPEWWMRNNICEKHDDYLRFSGGLRPGSPVSDHHAIRTEHVAQWIDRWDQLHVLRRPE